MSDPIDDALSIIFDHPGPWSEEMRDRMAKVLSGYVRIDDDEWFKRRYAAAIASGDYEHTTRVLSERLRQMDKRAAAANGRAEGLQAIIRSLTIPESNSTNAGEG